MVDGGSDKCQTTVKGGGLVVDGNREVKVDGCGSSSRRVRTGGVWSGLDARENNGRLAMADNHGVGSSYQVCSFESSMLFPSRRNL